MPPVSSEERLAAARVGHLATVTDEGRPHVVPCTFALHEGRIYTAVDAKPKRTQRLKRLANLRAHPHASLLVDHYEEDWARLWWIRVDGPAGEVLDTAERQRALAALAAKYPQYRDTPPAGPVIRLVAERWRSWSSVPSDT
jgi:PPOX class probable F420-dependent enzyme